MHWIGLKEAVRQHQRVFPRTGVGQKERNFANCVSHKLLYYNIPQGNVLSKKKE